jgi:hypothetical protein
VVQTATGKYTVQLTEWGEQIVESAVNVLHTTGATKQRAGVVKGSFDSSAGTVDIEVFTDDALSGVPALADVVSGDKVELKFGFVRSAP